MIKFNVMEIEPMRELLLENLSTYQLPNIGDLIRIPNQDDYFKVLYIVRSFKYDEEFNTIKVKRITEL